MLQVVPHLVIYLMCSPIDFRKGIDALAALCRTRLEQDPQSGALFLFRNRRRTALKILIYDGQGYWLCMKRLSSGKLVWWPDNGNPLTRLGAHELQTLLWNGNPTKAGFGEAWRRIESPIRQR